jgi:hypothetical protein
VKVNILVEEGPIHMNTKLSRELEEIFHAVAHRFGQWPDERPRSRTCSGLIVAHKGTLVGIELKQPGRVKIIKATTGGE